ncbi:hypothetical protein ABL78_7640 [Leptomonas seymouri]|uniref:Uncharacterized protein n=1 Tax=Leptomonas seymouri TaxID=5684 RepID=A0A0N1I0B3_LEPSE|nr:hypothetical protein ABL78_7640 [Leptomonas seymouri]|eukprot:KPI83331.1 hypothetical protein ABL78_7640 [Leptomonas seymouri]
MPATPWYCRYGIHGDVTRQTNIDGTALYRTRERPCDCTPPPPRPPLPALCSSMQPRRPEPTTVTTRRRPRGRGGAGCPRGRLPNRADHSPNELAPAYLSQPLAFYDGGLHVVVPPITVEQSGYPDALEDASLRLLCCDGGAINVFPAFPSIPVVWPQSELQGVHSDAAQREYSPVAEVAIPVGLDPNNAPPNVIIPTASSAAAASPSEVPTPSLGAVNPPPSSSPPAPAVVCSPERHALHASWGIAFCSTCGLPLHSSTPPCTSLTCPLGPHDEQLRNRQEPPSVTVAHAEDAGQRNFCMLCGADLKAAGATSSCPPEEPRCYRQASPMPPYADLLTRRDLHSVDEIMAHLLRNAEAHGGKVQPPCGLPNCRLCEHAEGAAGTADAAERRAIGATRPERWWDSPMVCGCPAVTIVHHHYYR